MKTNFYNSKDENYEHVKKLLKELPKVNAPDNFEFNLKTKIENKNFGLNSKRKIGFNLWGIFIPASGLIAASILAFVFLFNNNPESLDNPFKIIPKLRSEISSNFLGASNFNNIFDKSEKVNDLDVIVRENEKSVKKDLIAAQDKPVNKTVKPDVKKKDFPFENYASTDLDEVLKNKNNKNSLGRNLQLTGRGSSHHNYFNGFFMGEEVDKEYVEALKARLDSVKKDILNQKQKSRRAE